MMTIHYQIQLLTDWHCGTGLDTGIDVDAMVLRDENNLPYIPGKTIKGLLRDALTDIVEVQPSKATLKDLYDLFGYTPQRPGDPPPIESPVFFANAQLPKSVQLEISKSQLQPYLYRRFAQTAIDPHTGTVKPHTLRAIEFVMPLTLTGQIQNLTQHQTELLQMAMKWCRHIGLQRNRGFGLCRWSVVSIKDTTKP